MSEIWTPEQLTPPGWDPDEWYKVNSFSPHTEPTSVVSATVLRAFYYPDKETIAVHVKKEDGQEAISYLPKAAFKFRGKSHIELPKHETDKEMYRTAELFNKAQGRKIKLRVYDS